MFLSNSLAQLLKEIYEGESTVPCARRSRRKLRPASLHAGEDGMISMVTVVAVLFFLVMFGLVANVARTSNHKIEVQNTADAAAYSCTLSMARGMNTVTAANHVMGELTAVAVLIDALGGRELGQRKFCQQSQDLNTLLNTLGPVTTSAPPSPTARTLLPNLTKDNGWHTAGASIYDARLTLKFWTCWGLAARGLGIALSVVPALSAAIMALTELAFVKIAQEWQFLDVLESLANTLTPVRNIVEQALPLIHAYSASVARQTPLAVASTLRSVGEANGATAGIYPLAEEIELPIQPEAGPRQGGPTYRPGDDAPPLPSPAREMIEMFNSVKAMLNAASKLIDTFSAGALDKIKKLLDLELPSPPGSDGYPKDNPSQKPFEQLQIDYQWERQSQWVRATYPWVNAWRTPVKGAMDTMLTFSLISRWYNNWSNKYTLARSFQYRSEGAFFHVRHARHAAWP